MKQSERRVAVKRRKNYLPAFYFQDSSSSTLQVSCIARSYVSAMLSEVNKSNIDLHLQESRQSAEEYFRILKCIV